MPELPDDTADQMREAIQRIVAEHLDEEIGVLKARLLYDDLMKTLGQTAYNQALRDAQAYLQTRLVDMEIELGEEIPAT